MPITSARSGADERAALLPPELLRLFDDGFVRSCDLIEQYVTRLALGVVHAIGLGHACVGGATVDEAIVRTGLAPDVARVPVRWLLETLVMEGWAARRDQGDGSLRYQTVPALPILAAEEIAQAQAEHDPRCLPSYRIAATAAQC